MNQLTTKSNLPQEIGTYKIIYHMIVKKNYSGFGLTRTFYWGFVNEGFLKTESFMLFGFQVFGFLRVFRGVKGSG